MKTLSPKCVDELKKFHEQHDDSELGRFSEKLLHAGRNVWGELGRFQASRKSSRKVPVKSSRKIFGPKKSKIY